MNKSIPNARLKLSATSIKVIRYLITGIVFFLAGWYIYQNYEELKALVLINGWAVLALVCAGILRRFVDSARFAALYKALGAHIGLMENFGLSQVAATLNLLLPAQAGVVARAVYMKRQYALPLSQTPSILLGIFVFSLFIGACIMALSNSIIAFMGNSVPLILWLYVVVAGASVVLFWISIPEQLTSRLGRIGNMLRLFSDGWKSLRSNKRCLIETGIYQILTFIGSGLIITIAYYSLGVDINPLLGISIAVFIALSNTISITPGNFGIQEAVIGYLSQLSGILFVEGIAAATLIRVAGLVITFGIAPIAWYMLFFRQNIQIPRFEQPAKM